MDAFIVLFILTYFVAAWFESGVPWLCLFAWVAISLMNLNK